MKRIAAAVIASLAFATGYAGQDNYSPYAGENYPLQLLWGDTHVHSSYSMDANTMGNTRLAPDAAYRFAMGEEITSNTGQRVKLGTPLDFLVVSDHAEYMGVLPRLRAADPVLLKDPTAREIYDAINSGDVEISGRAIGKLIASVGSNKQIIENGDFQQSIWNEITSLADEYNKPGHFSALIGYEWTSMPGGDNLHRVVVYRDGADKANRMLPVSSFDGENPEDLWAFMGRYENATGGNILAIPHNANVSNGRMFAIEQSNGEPFSKEYAQMRARWEPVVEVTQIKGDGEAHPMLSPDDEFADYETWDIGNLYAVEIDEHGNVPEVQQGAPNVKPKKPGMLQYEYARPVLKLGLEMETRTGINPFKFGMIGSTDSHTSMATGTENNYWGKMVLMEPGLGSPGHKFTRITEGFISVSEEEGGAEIKSWQQVASGYAAVWATENTREAIFDAMQRKEVYATTGSRISLRFFGGWDYGEQDLFAADLVRNAYRKGVPMGADLKGKKGKTPGFLVMALKDPEGANLDRVQIVKGWREANGELREKVYNVAVSDGRKIRKNKVAPLKSTVKGATFDNSTGAATLQAFWQDPDFNPAEQAFYYVRVLEIPTPRWPAYDKARLGAELLPGTQVEVQDRAYSSPIWYSAN